ncbi:MAG: hypothetical protein NPIRA06_30870 [Nitrospirales bacterium]|nr:MAG: hypothetical protein NPIRA06_30870 [Nitrospirales bacterium]
MKRASPESDEQKQVYLPWNADQRNQQNMPHSFRRKDASLKILKGSRMPAAKHRTNSKARAVPHIINFVYCAPLKP